MRRLWRGLSVELRHEPVQAVSVPKGLDHRRELSLAADGRGWMQILNSVLSAFICVNLRQNINQSPCAGFGAVFPSNYAMSPYRPCLSQKVSIIGANSHWPRMDADGCRY